MPDQFENEHLRQLKQKEAELRKFYEDAIRQITIGYSQITFNGEVFQLKDFPGLLARIKNEVGKLHAQIYAATVNGIKESWDFANDKNNILVDKRLSGKKPSKRAVQILYDPNKDALKAFITRKEKGLNLSKRVWNTLSTYRTEMEAALGVGISEGRSAVQMAADLKKYLNDPDRLFRKVRGDDGKLKLSRAARNFHPGQGIYRSSFQNALRLTATETNMSYRTSDHERWKTLPFVKGIRVHLSNNHPTFDECDALSGLYPKDFIFKGWHPRCRCFSTAEQISDAEYDKYEDSILGLGEAPLIKLIEDIPAKAKQWIEKNAERIKGWANTPYWVKDNPDFVSL
jgi:hypothetical protein